MGLKIKNRGWRIFFRFSLAIFGLFLILVSILTIHIYQVTKGKNQNSTRLARIDFVQKPDSIAASAALVFLKKLPGIENTYFNIPDGILVYTYNSEKQSPAAVFELLTQNGNYKAKPYQVSNADIKKGCPAGAENGSFSASLAHGLQRLFQ